MKNLNSLFITIVIICLCILSFYVGKSDTYVTTTENLKQCYNLKINEKQKLRSSLEFKLRIEGICDINFCEYKIKDFYGCMAIIDIIYNKKIEQQQTFLYYKHNNIINDYSHKYWIKLHETVPLSINNYN